MRDWLWLWLIVLERLVVVDDAGSRRFFACFVAGLARRRVSMYSAFLMSLYSLLFCLVVECLFFENRGRHVLDIYNL